MTIDKYDKVYALVVGPNTLAEALKTIQNMSWCQIKLHSVLFHEQDTSGRPFNQYVLIISSALLYEHDFDKLQNKLRI